MDVVARAPQLIAALFGDEGGREVLREAGLGDSWQGVVAHVPPELLAVSGEEPGLLQLTSLRDFWSRRNDLRPAVAATRALLRLHIGRHGHDHPDTLLELGALGALAQRAGKVEEGGQLLERAWERLSAVAPHDLRRAIVGANLALHYVRAGALERAEPVLDTAWRIRTRVAPETTGQVAAQLGEVRARLGREEEASPLYEEAWKKLRAQLGPDHPRTIGRARAYGALLGKIGHHGLAIAPLRAVHDFVRRQGEPEATAAAAFELGVALDAVGQKEEGLRLVEEAIRWTREASRGDPHPALAPRLTSYASIQLQRGRPGEAEGLMREALEAERLLYGDDSAEVASRYGALGYYYARVGRLGEALGWLDAGASLMRSAAGDLDPRTRSMVAFQLELLTEQAQAAIVKRDKEMAREMLRRAWQLAVPVLGHADRNVLKVRELADGLGLRL